jgi:hypothetical protein
MFEGCVLSPPTGYSNLDDDEETDFTIEGEFRKMRTSRKIRMPGGLQRDERIYDPVDRYRDNLGLSFANILRTMSGYCTLAITRNLLNECQKYAIYQEVN